MMGQFSMDFPWIFHGIVHFYDGFPVDLPFTPLMAGCQADARNQSQPASSPQGKVHLPGATDGSLMKNMGEEEQERSES